MAVQSTEDDTFFDKEAKIVFDNLNLSKEEIASGSFSHSCIYIHPETKAKVYVGGKQAATNRNFFVENNVSGVINCTSNQQHYFSSDSQLNISYTRFQIALWNYDKSYKFGDSAMKNSEVLRFADSILDLVDGYLEEGKSVLIHCLAGAHRAGTTGVMFIMAKLKLHSEEAIKVAKSLRSVINPLYSLAELLLSIDKAVIELNKAGMIQPNRRWYREDIV